MINWDNFYIFVIITILCWGVASLFSLFSNSLNRRKNFAVCLYIIGIIAMATFIIGLGLYLKRPPMRTMGEIRLWYAFLLGIVGLIIYLRWNFSWILLFTSVLSSVFLIINLIRPELHNQTLMPALQSIWFVPHVIIYMSSYALLGGSFFIALYGLMKKNTNYLHACDQLVIAGTAFFTLAMLIGSLWAKAAWGHYWTWDAKELWAAITWMMYLFYLHFRNFKSKSNKTSMSFIIAFIALQMCWYGVNIFPSLKESLHSYI